MTEYREVFKQADILVPNSDNYDISAYPVIACDQHTSEPEYWHSVEEIVGDKCSTLNMIIPEIYLDKSEILTAKAHQAMVDYQQNELEELRNSVIFCERTQRDGRARRGVVCALDLECYDYKTDSTAYVLSSKSSSTRATPFSRRFFSCR